MNLTLTYHQLKDKIPTEEKHVTWFDDDPTDSHSGQVCYEFISDDPEELMMYHGTGMEDMFIDKSPPLHCSKFFRVIVDEFDLGANAFWIYTDDLYVAYNKAMGEDIYNVDDD